MKQDELPPYEPWMDALLEAERKPESLPLELEERLLQRLLNAPAATIDEAVDEDVAGSFEGGGGSALSTSAAETLPSAVAAKAATTTGLVASAKLLMVASGAAGLLLGAAAGATGYALLTPAKERIVTRVEVREVKVPVAVPAAPEAAVSASPPSTLDAADAGAVPRASAAKPRNLTKSESRPARDTELADENALITRAQNALARGRPEEALEATREHERSYARGRFVEEREALAIQALARQGNLRAASARAERFYQRYPNSLLTRLVRAVVKTP